MKRSSPLEQIQALRFIFMSPAQTQLQMHWAEPFSSFGEWQLASDREEPVRQVVASDSTTSPGAGLIERL